MGRRQRRAAWAGALGSALVAATASAAPPGMSPPPKPTSMSGESMGGMSKSGMGTGSGDMPMQTGGMTPPSKPVAGALGSIGGMSMGGMAGRNAPASTPSAPMAGMGGSAPAQPAPLEVAPMTTVAETDPRNKLPVSDASQVAPADLKGAVDVDNVAAKTKNRLGEAGDGLDGNGRPALVYTDLASRSSPDHERRPDRGAVRPLRCSDLPVRGAAFRSTPTWAKRVGRRGGGARPPAGRAAAALAFVSGVSVFVLTVGGMADDPGAALNGATLAGVVTGTSFGNVYALRLVALAASRRR